MLTVSQWTAWQLHASLHRPPEAEYALRTNFLVFQRFESNIRYVGRFCRSYHRYQGVRTLPCIIQSTPIILAPHRFDYIDSEEAKQKAAVHHADYYDEETEEIDTEETYDGERVIEETEETFTEETFTEESYGRERVTEESYTREVTEESYDGEVVEESYEDVEVTEKSYDDGEVVEETYTRESYSSYDS
jgi:hypothetical protein